ncbi:putative protein-serine/threonine phosphatase [Helianthus annuus]|nr:putative protein-serine/threonine phosphatase [Helianthus annuus]
MGGGFSHLLPCFNPAEHRRNHSPDLIFTAAEPLDETLGHSFCYVRSSARFISPTHSDRFNSPSQSLRFSPESSSRSRQVNGVTETGFRSISGASVSANSLTPVTVVKLDNIVDDDVNRVGVGGGVRSSGSHIVSGFESTSSFSALPLQPLPRGDSARAAVGQMERAFFMSGPIERGALSGPLDSSMNIGSDSVNSNGVPFSAPLNGGGYVKKRRKRSVNGIRKAFNRNFPRPWVVPVRNFVGRKESSVKGGVERSDVKNDSFRSGGEEIVTRRKRLWEYLAEEGPRDGLDLSGSERFAFSVDDALSISKTSSGANHRSFLLSKLRNGLTKHKEGSKLFGWKLGLDSKEQKEAETRVEETDNVVKNGRKKKTGPVDHEQVLRAMSRALEVTEFEYLDMTDKVMDQYPELALMGSCLLAVLMRDEDVYVMNLGDSRAIVAQDDETKEAVLSQTTDSGTVIEDVVKESIDADGKENCTENEGHAHDKRLTALQLSTDHSTSIEEEVTRIKNEHPDDDHCIVNDRVKGRLKVTRAFGVGSLKQAKWNDSLLEMFRNEYIGNAPYISCVPSLRHHQLCKKDQFLVLSSDGLYQYFSNQEVVSHVDSFMEKFPDGDPAQHLIEELLLRAAKKAGMDLHELLDIPQGDRRKYHDDVTVMVVSLEGRIWKSSGKYL